ncbi:hypothetical protein HPB49_011594 [Dermacentor silvarum]|uniref:Uncharacterized protein n=1 Tax=Dermacentor silvarum TaxID=543639 RepID=A0ACB8D514_DERSI|nr:hypothetical protein HPB49_011594 [Dermacentor silvarum]
MARDKDIEIVLWKCQNLRHDKTPFTSILMRPSLPDSLLLQETRTARTVPGYRPYQATKGTPLASIYTCSFLYKQVARFRVDTHLSNPPVLTRGTPQGAVLCPTHFNIVMTPLASEEAKIFHLHHTFYADDIPLWCSFGSPGQVQDTLQHGLDPIASFLTTAGL